MGLSRKGILVPQFMTIESLENSDEYYRMECWISGGFSGMLDFWWYSHSISIVLLLHRRFYDF